MKKGLPWKLIDGPEFKSVKTVLDNVMKERAQENVGMVKKQAGAVNYEVEDFIMETKCVWVSKHQINFKIQFFS